MTETPSLPLPKNAAELEAVLLRLTLPDTEKIKQATAILKQFLKQTTCVQALMQQIVASTKPEARQLAAVLLRTSITKHVKKLTEEQQEAVKGTLLKRLMEETDRNARRGVAALISSLAKKLVPAGKWNQLLTFLLQCSKSPEAGQREISMVLFRALAENIGKVLKPHFGKLQEIFQAGLNDDSEAVRLEAMKALNTLVEFLETDKEVTAFRSVIPPLVTSTKKAIAEGKEEPAAICFEIFDNVAALPVDVLMHHVVLLVEFILNVAANKELDISVREKGSALIAAMIAHKPGKITKSNLAAPIMKCALVLITEESEEAFDTAEEMTPQKMGVEILDAVILNMPRRITFETIMAQASKLLKAADNAHFRKGGFVVLAVMAEGFCELLKPNLETLLKAITAGVRDSNQLVRAAAMVALTQFADYLQPEISQFHAVMIPNLMLPLENKDETVTVKKKACVALDVFCEQLGSQIVPYMDGLMKKFVLLTSSKDLSLVAQAVSGIKSVACAAEQKFLKYLKPTCDMMKNMMEQTDDEKLDLRAAATDCVGEIANAVGKDKFKPFLQGFLGLAVRGMELEYYGLREKTYAFFANLATMLEKDFTPLLETVMPFAIASCISEDGLQFTVDDQALQEEGIAGMADEDEVDDEKDEELGMKRLKYRIRSGALDEKVAAIQCIHTIVERVGDGVIQYLPTTVEKLKEVCDYPHPLVRAATVRCYAEILGALHRKFPPKEKWTPGVGKPLAKQVAACVKEVYPLMLQRLVEEEDKETCACACDLFAETAKLFGLAPFEPIMKKLVEAISLLLKEKAPCQNAAEDDDNVQGDHDEVLIDSVTDVISALAEICGPKFDSLFKTFVPLLLKFYQPQRPFSDRAMAIGCIAESAEHMGTAIAPYLPSLFPVIFKGMADPHAAVRRNSAFCCGVLCQIGGDAAKKFCAPALNGLKGILEWEVKTEEKATEGKIEEKEEKEHRQPARDNAASAIAKIITKQADSVPLGDAVRLFISGLPLKSDFSEGKHCYPLIVQLFKAQPKLIGPFMPQVISICSQVLGSDEKQVSKEHQDELLELCRALSKSHGPQVKTILAALAAPLRENFLKHLQGASTSPAKSTATSTDSTPATDD